MTHSCEPPDGGAEDQIQVVWKSRSGLNSESSVRFFILPLHWISVWISRGSPSFSLSLFADSFCFSTEINYNWKVYSQTVPEENLQHWGKDLHAEAWAGAPFPARMSGSIFKELTSFGRQRITAWHYRWHTSPEREIQPASEFSCTTAKETHVHPRLSAASHSTHWDGFLSSFSVRSAFFSGSLNY